MKLIKSSDDGYKNLVLFDKLILKLNYEITTVQFNSYGDRGHFFNGLPPLGNLSKKTIDEINYKYVNSKNNFFHIYVGLDNLIYKSQFIVDTKNTYYETKLCLELNGTKKLGSINNLYNRFKDLHYKCSELKTETKDIIEITKFNSIDLLLNPIFFIKINNLNTYQYNTKIYFDLLKQTNYDTSN